MKTQQLVAAKKATRQRVLALRDALTVDQRAQQSAVITGKLLALPQFSTAAVVAAYLCFGTEFDTEAFARAVLASGKRLALPRVDRGTRTMHFHFVSDLQNQLLPGMWGIRQPDPAHCPLAEAGQIDLMLVPGVAFTPRCERLGYGGGFYDAVISHTRTEVAKVAAAFSLQVVEELPVEPHDRRVDLVITEDAEYVSSP